MTADRDWLPWFPSLLATVLTVAAAGCTIGPDPFDYSGPVPNGSPPQNDFRARSNGILPLGAAPRPFPPLVDAGPAPADVRSPQGDENLADEGVRVAATDFSVDVVKPVSSEQGVAADAADEDDAVAPADVAESQPLEESLPAPLAETPGWRTRD
ncbi:MAG: hypothetical protein DWI03_02685 [Planctomycetota bacterium]|jgi:hypothetical protein|nr:MAG: hypothetical protein DWI03_02685 [Planctomycetota bacterium]